MATSINKLYDGKKAWLAKNEETLISQFTTHIHKALIGLGENIKCHSWFCSKADENLAKKAKTAA